MNNPSLIAVSNAYRRRFGQWPTWARFHPVHFGHWVSGEDPDALVRLGSRMRLIVTPEEPSPRMTVGGQPGELTYDDGVTDDDWDPSEFNRWLSNDNA